MQTAEAKRYHLRWMIRRDIPEVLEAERKADGLGWSKDEILTTLRGRNCIGMVAERGEYVHGFMVYEIRKHYLRILNICVHPGWQRMGAGAAMIEKLKSKLSSHRRQRIIVDVPDDKLGMHLFLRSQAFRAVSVTDGAYQFRFEF